MSPRLKVKPADLTVTWADADDIEIRVDEDGPMVVNRGEKDVEGYARITWPSPTGEFVVLLPERKRRNYADPRIRRQLAEVVDTYYAHPA